MKGNLSRRRFLWQGGAVTVAPYLHPSAFGQPPADTGALKTNIPIRQLTADLERLIPEIIKRLKVPGLAVALVREAEVIWHRGFGVTSVETSRPVAEDTVFEAASFSKPVTAYAALKLRHKGEIDLDTPLIKYLKKLNIPDDPRLSKITLAHVLSHTSGLTTWMKEKSSKISFTPGERFAYSGAGFGYLQTVIEQITGKPLQELAKSTLFDPMGMPDSNFIWDDRLDARKAVGHNREGKPNWNWKPRTAQAMSSLSTTVGDYARFMAEMMRPSKNDGTRLPADALTEMIKPRVDINASLSWGLGWGIQRGKNIDSFWHWGNNNWCICNFAVGYQKEGCGIVILTNSGNGMAACKEIVPLALGGIHPAFSWQMVLP